VLLEKLKLKIKKKAPNAPGMLSKHYARRLPLLKNDVGFIKIS
jgi:hypothetical protein